MARRTGSIVVLLLFLGLQGSFWHHTRDIRPEMGIVPDVPGETAVRALSFGDTQFLFRLLALNLQNAGDTFGRFTALYKYDFEKLSQWFSLLDTLDDRSDFIPTIASYYFSQTQYTPDIRYVVDYLYAHSAHRAHLKWWWLVQAVYLANHKLEDKDLALKAAAPLQQAEGVPVWVRQMPAFLHEQRGEFDAALAIMQNLQANAENLSAGELNFINYFIRERLGALEAAIGQ